MPCVVDRLIRQAMLQVFQERWDPTFSEHSYGFRPGRSAHQAVALRRVAARVSDKPVLKLIQAFLNTGVMEDGLVRQWMRTRRRAAPLGVACLLAAFSCAGDARQFCFVPSLWLSSPPIADPAESLTPASPDDLGLGARLCVQASSSRYPQRYPAQESKASWPLKPSSSGSRSAAPRLTGNSAARIELSVGAGEGNRTLV